MPLARRTEQVPAGDLFPDRCDHVRQLVPDLVPERFLTLSDLQLSLAGADEALPETLERVDQVIPRPTLLCPTAIKGPIGGANPSMVNTMPTYSTE